MKKTTKNHITVTINAVMVCLLSTLFTFIALYFFMSTNSEYIFEEAITNINYDYLQNTFSNDPLAVQLAALCSAKNSTTTEQVRCVHTHYTSFFHYINREDDTERIPSQLEEGGGDCSDFSLAICSTLKNMNISCRISTYSSSISGHAYNKIMIGNRTCEIDQLYTDCYSW